MKKLLYPLIASALITITPFLITFEKGQDIVRGLFGFSEFALLLLFACARDRTKGALRIVLLVAISALILAVAWIDLQNLLALKNWNTGVYGVIPLLTCSLAVAMMAKVPSFPFPTISFIVFVSLIAHLAALNWNASQPLAQFPVVDYLSRTAPNPVERKVLPESFVQKYKVVDSVTVTRHYVDTLRSNVVILVESWGVPMEESRFTEELRIFDGVVQQLGVHSRMYSRTRTAEREDLMLGFTRDSVTHAKDTTFLPQELAKKGFKTSFFFGGDSAEQWRYKYIYRIFKNAYFGGFNPNARPLAVNAPKLDLSLAKEALPDSVMAEKIDSVLSDSTALDSTKQFIAWTTRDTKFPLQGLGGAYQGSADENDSAYTVRLMGTLRLIADLARRHPDVRFVVQGDHEPILSPVAFQERFYKRWVPFIVLN
ncbi:hypothetical protein [Hallerella sp.]|uniref:hypothetical protein n=1 Tax=Hallerella sp. TaxID=2815812 RepID=UPI002583BA77|nr:hypothetical protein [Hallerella sp.]MCI6872569.1 hypothetical protein [Hallerella sp.]